MTNCPVCNTALSENICPECGYDLSRDYGRFPTFGRLSSPVPAPVPIITAVAAASSYCAVRYSDGSVRICDKNSDLEWMEPKWEPVCAIYPGQKHLYGKTERGIMLQLPLDIPYSKDLLSCSRNLRSLVHRRAKIDIDAPYSGALLFSSEHPYLEAVAEGTVHTLCLPADGSVFPKNFPGHSACQTGHWSDVTSIAVSPDHSFGLTKSGTVLVAGDLRRKISRVQAWRNIAAISAGNDHIVGLCRDGSVCAAGNNHSGQCDVRGWYDIAAVTAGHSHTVGLRENGSVIATGNNTDSQCGVTHWHDIIAVAAGDYFTVGLKRDGTLVCTDEAIEAAFRDLNR